MAAHIECGTELVEVHGVTFCETCSMYFGEEPECSACGREMRRRSRERPDIFVCLGCDLAVQR
jgi:uncharacterized paraquat-inducible protein A